MIIAQEVIDVLKKSRVEDNKLFLPTENGKPIPLERKLYKAVNKCLELIGGKWNTKAKAHLFDRDPGDLLEQMINTGEVTDTKKELQFFPTPESVADKMFGLVSYLMGPPNDISNEVWLEPSCGDGALLNWFPVDAPKIAFDISPELVEKARERVGVLNGYIMVDDFLTKTVYADVIVMNPPFTRQQDIKHIMHAWECLKPDGCLVSVVSESPFFRETKEAIAFRQWLKDNNATVIDLKAGDFKESGTMVKTRIIGVKK